jgi:hypothetical protein
VRLLQKCKRYKLVHIKNITMAARSEVPSVSRRSNTGIVGSNPTRGTVDLVLWTLRFP